MEPLSESNEPSASEFSAKALLAAAGAGVLGVALWAVILVVTRYEVGYAAWAIGAMIGFAAHRMGARGFAMGACCAGLTLAAILGGKLVGAQFVVKQELDNVLEQQLTREAYASARSDADALDELGSEPSDAELRTFLVERGFSMVEDPDDVTDDELALFRQETADYLRRIHAESPSYEQWREAVGANVSQYALDTASLFGLIRENLNGFDLLFAALGVTTAFGMVNRKETQAAA